MKTALITGISGQDGSYLASFLLGKGYQVVGQTRGGAKKGFPNLRYLGIESKIPVHAVDLLDFVAVQRMLQVVQPDEVYHLSADSSVHRSFQHPLETMEYNTLPVCHLLEGLRQEEKKFRFFFAGSSEMFGKVDQPPVTFATPLHPINPYGVSKASGFLGVQQFREAFGLFAVSGVLFPHESLLRKEGFFVRKVIQGGWEIKNGRKEVLRVGNLDQKRDFGYAPEYVKAMWLMLQQQVARDFLIASGKGISLRRIVEHVFGRLGIPMERVEVDPSLFRLVDVGELVGDSSPLRQELGWEYDRDFEQVLDLMLEEMGEAENKKGGAFP
ncbi:MAG TPA: GDP-mannose 4,6-dehydratase [Thermotogota bacterium]|nr:GDP-mannose 4,6-dehydratase [Thermotogota bacterium]HRW93613.1 GDP-mannose 4,6-dehydratase [Thermotogota bacterium]